MPNGLFFTLEGGEGVGKTTQNKLLQERLPQLYPDREFVFTREPGGTPFADKIREVILSDEAKEADGKTMFGLFLAARAEHIRRVILPDYEAGKVVLSDRFATATFAYQVCAMGNPISEDFFVEYYDQLEIQPELTLILDLAPEVSQARVASRSTQMMTHFDTRPPAFHHDLRMGYARFAHMYDTRSHAVKIIPAEGTPEEVHARLMQRIQPLLA